MNRFYEMKKSGGKTKVHACTCTCTCGIKYRYSGSVYMEYVMSVLDDGDIIIIFVPLQQRRPYLASECDNLRAAEKWRVQVSYKYHQFCCW